jgi:hypothetical protein
MYRKATTFSAKMNTIARISHLNSMIPKLIWLRMQILKEFLKKFVKINSAIHIKCFNKSYKEDISYRSNKKRKIKN